MGNKFRKRKSGVSRSESHDSSEGGYFTPTVESATSLVPSQGSMTNLLPSSDPPDTRCVS